MKIAAVTDNSVKLSSHFGMAPAYRVFTVEAGKIVKDEIIEKPHHGADHHTSGHQHDTKDAGAGKLHTLDAPAPQDHAEHEHHGHGKFFNVIKDCQVLLVGGMGEPAYQHALSFGFEVFMTGGDIEAAVQAYLNGELVSDLRRVHSH